MLHSTLFRLSGLAAVCCAVLLGGLLVAAAGIAWLGMTVFRGVRPAKSSAAVVTS